MHSNYKLWLIAIIATLFVACDADIDAFDRSPAQRNAESIAALKAELTAAEHGWRVLYFPRTDSLLFSNPSELIPQFGFRGRYGYGGHCFSMKFHADNTLEMKADYNASTASTPLTSEYNVGRNSFTQLSFITQNYVHELVNDAFRASSDWLYMGKNADGDLVFRTVSYLEPAREYIVFTKMTNEEQWQRTTNKALENREYFESMVNPQLSIHRGSRTYFRSDIYVKRDVETNKSLLREIKAKKYYLFLFAQKKNPIPGYPAKEIVGLGSGYGGTEHGLTFRAGLRYDSKTMFFDFERVGQRFRAELVEVYDPLLRKTRLVSKHLHPEGIETGLVAEIWDEGDDR